MRAMLQVTGQVRCAAALSGSRAFVRPAIRPGPGACREVAICARPRSVHAASRGPSRCIATVARGRCTRCSRHSSRRHRHRLAMQEIDRRIVLVKYLFPPVHQALRIIAILAFAARPLRNGCGGFVVFGAITAGQVAAPSDDDLGQARPVAEPIQPGNAPENSGGVRPRPRLSASFQK